MIMMTKGYEIHVICTCNTWYMVHVIHGDYDHVQMAKIAEENQCNRMKGFFVVVPYY